MATRAREALWIDCARVTWRYRDERLSNFRRWPQIREIREFRHAAYRNLVRPQIDATLELVLEPMAETRRIAMGISVPDKDESRKSTVYGHRV